MDDATIREIARVLVRETEGKWFPTGHGYLPLARKVAEMIDARAAAPDPVAATEPTASP